MKTVAGALAILLTIASASAAQATLPDPVAVSEAAIGNQLPSMTFIDTNGKKVALDDFRGKPLLISLVYTGCTDICPAIIENLHPAVEVAQSALGKDSFTVITVGFDTRHDTPDRMRSFARSRGVDLPNWLFLSSSQSTVEKLASVTGFTIVPSAAGFDHMAQVSVIDADGKIYQQIMGGVFSPPTIVEPLKDLMFDTRKPFVSIAGIAERIKLFCTVYNPNTGRYYFNYSLIIGIFIGIACLLSVIFWLFNEFRLSGGPRGDARP